MGVGGGRPATPNNSNNATKLVYLTQEGAGKIYTIMFHPQNTTKLIYLTQEGAGNLIFFSFSFSFLSLFFSVLFFSFFNIYLFLVYYNTTTIIKTIITQRGLPEHDSTGARALPTGRP